MVATLVRLRWRLTLNALRHNVWALVGTVVGGLYGIGALVSLVAAAIGLGLAGDASMIGLVLGSLGALLGLGWLLLPLLATGMDTTLDPRAMAAWTAPSRRLSTGLLVAGATGLPGSVTALICLVPVLTWALAGQWGAAVLALVMAPLALAVCVLVSRIVVTAAGVSGSRRGREMVGMVAVIVVLSVSFLPLVLTSTGSAGLPQQAEGVGRALAWTPFGWPFAAPGALASGHVSTALGMVLGSCALVVGLLPLWERVVARVMTSPGRASARARAYEEVGARAGSAGTHSTGSGRALADVLPWFRRLERVLPPVAAAVSARCLRYWRSDPRYLTQALSLVFIPVVITVAVLFSGAAARTPSDSDVAITVDLAPGHASATLLVLAPLLALMMGWALHDDVGMDSTAFWSHVSAGVRGRDDRLGRVAAAVLWQVPLILLVAGGTAWWTGRWEWLPLVLAASAAFLGCALAWSSVSSAVLPYETNAPGDNPMKSRTSGTAFLAALLQLVGIGFIGLLTLPVVGGAAAVAVAGAWPWAWAVLVLGLVWGAGVAWIGVVLGGRELDRRGARLLATIQSWPGHAQPS